MIKIPKYRIDEIMKIYSVFYDKNKNNVDLKDRKIKLKTIIKNYYNWLTDDEYNYIYNLIKTREIDLIIADKKLVIEREYKNDIIKLFGKIDSNNSESIDLIEFKNIFSLIELEKDVETIFKDADTNRDNRLTIDEFIIFIAKNNDIFKKLDIVVQNKFELKLKNDKRTILFNNFPGSPLKINWRPSLSNLNNLNDIKKNMY
jgi:Ca2+-binding EF-hand superfamily protein